MSTKKALVNFHPGEFASLYCGADPQRAVPSSGHRRPEPWHRDQENGGADGPRRRCGGSRWDHGGDPPQPRQSPLRCRADAEPRAVPSDDGRPQADRLSKCCVEKFR